MDRRVFLFSSLAALASFPASAQSLSHGQAARGLRTALDQAARLATNRLGRRDGFWGDPQVRIPLPRQVASIQSTLRRVGMSGAIDDLELGLNRAAESAMPAARDIFVSAIRDMSVSDAVDIVRGSDTAATEYLRRSSGPLLERALEPHMQSAMSSAGVYGALDRIEPHINRGNSFLGRFGIGGTSADDLAERLSDHAVDKALDGVFYYVGQEERAIRRDPLGQASSILRRVFG